MARNGSGTFAVLNPIQIGALRSSTSVNQDFTDAGTEITNTLPLDGTVGMLGPVKLAPGDDQGPGLSFKSDTNVGFRRMDADEMAWVGGGVDRFYVDINGKAWFVAAGSVAGALSVDGTFTGSNDVAALEALSGIGLARRTAPQVWDLEDGTHQFGWVFDNAGVDLPPNLVADIMIPYACTLTGVGLLPNTSGSAAISIWKDTYANYPPTAADSIVASTPPTFTNALGYVDDVLTGWTVAVAAGDVIRFKIQSISGIQQLSVVLLAKRFA